jgi:hypothetical protein
MIAKAHNEIIENLSIHDHYKPKRNKKPKEIEQPNRISKKDANRDIPPTNA